MDEPVYELVAEEVRTDDEDPSFDFEEEDRADTVTTQVAGASSEEEGADPDALVPVQAVAPTPLSEEPPALAPSTMVPVWDPTKPLSDASFGIRVVATLLELQPPRAVLGLSDGTEHVVTPGAMLESEGLLVLAIGRDAVQIAKITPQGFHASVQTETVRTLYAGDDRP
ncbi:MAG: hypothetical protein KTR31_04785 [Myxococcales bacterium]|nr:hypothetical protein [Myxococcales bacterium]